MYTEATKDVGLADRVIQIELYSFFVSFEALVKKKEHDLQEHMTSAINIREQLSLVQDEFSEFFLLIKCHFFYYMYAVYIFKFYFQYYSKFIYC